MDNQVFWELLESYVNHIKANDTVNLAMFQKFSRKGKLDQATEVARYLAGGAEIIDGSLMGHDKEYYDPYMKEFYEIMASGKFRAYAHNGNNTYLYCDGEVFITENGKAIETSYYDDVNGAKYQTTRISFFPPYIAQEFYYAGNKVSMESTSIEHGGVFVGLTIHHSSNGISVKIATEDNDLVMVKAKKWCVFDRKAGNIELISKTFPKSSKEGNQSG